MPSISKGLPFIYVLLYADNLFEVGTTEDVCASGAFHDSGSASDDRRLHGPVSLSHLEGPYMPSAVVARERLLKSWPHQKIKTLCTRSARNRAKLRQEITDRGGWYLSGEPELLNGKTEQQLREHLSVLKWDEELNRPRFGFSLN